MVDILPQVVVSRRLGMRRRSSHRQAPNRCAAGYISCKDLFALGIVGAKHLFGHLQLLGMRPSRLLPISGRFLLGSVDLNGTQMSRKLTSTCGH